MASKSENSDHPSSVTENRSDLDFLVVSLLTGIVIFGLFFLATVGRRVALVGAALLSCVSGIGLTPTKERDEPVNVFVRDRSRSCLLSRGAHCSTVRASRPERENRLPLTLKYFSNAGSNMV